MGKLKIVAECLVMVCTSKEEAEPASLALKLRTNMARITLGTVTRHLAELTTTVASKAIRLLATLLMGLAAVG